jgi:hypothetical protein
MGDKQLMPSALTIVVFLGATLASVIILFVMPLLMLLVKVCCVFVPIFIVVTWFKWDLVEELLKWRAEKELTHEFGTTDVCVEKVVFKFGGK